MVRITPLVAGNWKMNGTASQLAEAAAIAEGVGQPSKFRCEVMICPPATLVAQTAWKLKGTAVAVGAQDCHPKQSGAHTGDISAEMLADAGAKAVIVGHSERRSDHGETDREVRAKAEAAFRAGLTAIICIGETAGQRRAGLALDIVARQLAGSLPDNASATNMVIAYEPVWAIGTGLTASPADVAEVHAFLRKRLMELMPSDGSAARILYGGSVKAQNAADLASVPDVNGALVGGASLKAADFLGILNAYAN
jgi:triosephosphate isomerase (TIM)